MWGYTSDGAVGLGVPDEDEVGALHQLSPMKLSLDQQPFVAEQIFAGAWQTAALSVQGGHDWGYVWGYAYTGAPASEVPEQYVPRKLEIENPIAFAAGGAHTLILTAYHQ